MKCNIFLNILNKEEKRKASMIENSCSKQLFASCSEKRKLDFSSQKLGSAKNYEKSSLPKNYKKKHNKPKITRKKENLLKLPNYLKNVKSKIKEEVEFHKRAFKASQKSPDFHFQEQMYYDQNQNHIINEFITFGSSKNPSPISTLKWENNEGFQKVDENSNIGEIANSFLKSPFMQFVEVNNKNKNEEFSQIQIIDSYKNSTRRSPKNHNNNSGYVFNDITHRFLNCDKEASQFLRKDISSFSNLIRVEQNSDGDSLSSTFSRLPTNEEMQGFFKKEFILNNSSKESQNFTSQNNSDGNIIYEKITRRDRESDIGKIVSVNKKEKDNKENFY